MIGLQGRGSAFFAVQGLNFDESAIDPKDLISLTVTEELGKITQGSIKLHDHHLTYARLLSTGAQLALSWGYASSGDIGDVGRIADELTAVRTRRGLRVMLMNPAGSGSGGDVEFSANFWAVDVRGLQQHILYQGMTRGAMIAQVMQRLGIATPEVNFTSASINLTAGTAERQAETDFAFLARKAQEWRCHLAVGHDPQGVPVGAFVDVDKIDQSAVVQRITGSTASGVELAYNAGDASNCQSYEWQCHEGENGAGDGVQMVMVNGVPQMIRYTVEGETVKTWRLNEQRLQDDYGKRDLRGQFSLTLEIATAKDFDQVKKYFDAVDQTTAPNGRGYTVTTKVLGNPLLVPPCRVQFGEGFPDRLRQKGNVESPGVRFFLLRNTHSIDRSGYFGALEIVDVPGLIDAGLNMQVPAALPAAPDKPGAIDTGAVPKTQTPVRPAPIKPGRIPT
jgi:hypothetical protein